MKKTFVIAYILFLCVFTFLPKSVETGVFILFILAGAVYVGINPQLMRRHYGQEAEIRRLRKLFLLFVYVSAAYFLLSFINLPHIWGIRGLMFKHSFIPRHFVVVAELFLPILLAESLQKIQFFNRIQTIPLILFLLLVFYKLRYVMCMNGVFMVTLALISWKTRKKWVMLPAVLISYNMSSYLLSFLAMMFLIYLEKPVTRYLYKHTLRKIIVLSSLAVIFIFIISGLLVIFVKNDPNSLWRLHVWQNELSSLKQTYFTGVGFGSAYVTDDIIYKVSNSNMYFNNADRSLEYGVFTVANHSSILNMFYRMGLVGGFIFLAMNVQLICLVVKLYHDSKRHERALLWRLFGVWIYQTVIIFLNPGLEMMQFAVSYLLSVAFLLAVVLMINKRRFKEQTELPTLFDSCPHL